MAPAWEVHFQLIQETENSLYPYFGQKHYTNQISNQSLGKVIHISPNMRSNRKIHRQDIVSRLLGAWQRH